MKTEKIEYNQEIYATTCGLIISGYDLYDKSNDTLHSFIQEIYALDIHEEVCNWFKQARTGQVEVNPYWPRGFALLSAAYFVSSEGYFNLENFMNFFDNTGIEDPISRQDFRGWISAFPHMLGLMKNKTAGLWKKYCKILDGFKSEYLDAVNKANDISRDFFGENAKDLIFVPNPLFSPNATDFVHIGEKIAVIGHSCDVESMLHESLHVELAKYRDKFTNLVSTHGIKKFANPSKMSELGYKNESAIIEECFVRAISTILSSGDAMRLSAHANQGFTSVSLIGQHFISMHPTSSLKVLPLGLPLFSICNLDELVQCILNILNSEI